MLVVTCENRGARVQYKDTCSGRPVYWLQ